MNELVNKIGLDKIAHFGIGGLICACVTFVIMLQDGMTGDWRALLAVIAGFCATFILAIIKEMIDDEPSLTDIVASVLGCLPVLLSVATGVLFGIISA